VPQKTKIVTYPKIDESLHKHFIRGVFDGDGCVYLNKNNRDVKATLVSASLEFLVYIKNITDQINIRSSIRSYNTYYVLSYSGNGASKQFLHFIYDDSTLFLKRKKEKFSIIQDWISTQVKTQKHRRPVEKICLTGNVRYESAVEAERLTGIKYQNIRFCCDNSNRTAGGFKWIWV
jgi:hypothetical protein